MFDYKHIDKKNSLAQLFDVFKNLKQQEQLQDEGFLRKQTLEDLLREYFVKQESYGGPGSDEL